MTDLNQTVIAERYELIEIIGRGGQGVIYRAHDRMTERQVAIKMLMDRSSRKAEYAARLAREQQALVALAGTSAVAFYDLCRAPNGALCLVMELLEGTDLEVILLRLEERGQRIELERLLEVLDPIVRTMERAHDRGIVHRDLKPANIFLVSESRGGGVRLLDFGLSRMKASDPLTVMGTVVGSPSYIAPEVWRGQPGELDHRVDVYSFGVIVFRALAGKLPFDGETLHDKLVLATTAPRPSLRALREELPKPIDAWVQRALAIDRGARFSSIRKLWNALHRALGKPAPSRDVAPVTKSLINAWRAAASAFRRFVEQRPEPVPSTTTSESSPDPFDSIPNGESSVESAAALDSHEEWVDVDEEEIIESERPVRRSEVIGLLNPEESEPPHFGDHSGVHEVDVTEWAGLEAAEADGPVGPTGAQPGTAIDVPPTSDTPYVQPPSAEGTHVRSDGKARSTRTASRKKGAKKASRAKGPGEQKAGKKRARKKVRSGAEPTASKKKSAKKTSKAKSRKGKKTSKKPAASRPAAKKRKKKSPKSSSGSTEPKRNAAKRKGRGTRMK